MEMLVVEFPALIARSRDGVYIKLALVANGRGRENGWAREGKGRERENEGQVWETKLVRGESCFGGGVWKERGGGRGMKVTNKRRETGKISKQDKQKTEERKLGQRERNLAHWEWMKEWMEGGTDGGRKKGQEVGGEREEREKKKDEQSTYAPIFTYFPINHLTYLLTVCVLSSCLVMGIVKLKH